MAERLGESLAGAVPQTIITGDVDGLRFAGAVVDGQAAAGADRFERAADLKRGLLHRAADLREMFQVRARTDVHVQAGDAQAVRVGPAEAVVELFVPDAVLRLGAAGVRLLAVAVAEAGVD